MTDPTDDRRWFHDHVDPVLDAEPVTAGWDAIADRLDGVAPEPATTGPARRPGRTVVAVAAAVALLTGAALVVRSVTDDGTEPAAVTTGEPDATGWYVPEGLPEGWSLAGVEAKAGQPTCDGRGTEWSDPEGGRSIGVSFDACGTAPTEDDLPGADLSTDPVPTTTVATPYGPELSLTTTELGDGVVASAIVLEDHADPQALLDPARTRRLTWDAPGGGAWTVATVGFTQPELVEVAQAVAADPETDLAEVVDGDLRPVDRWTRAAAGGDPVVEVLLHGPGESKVLYWLSVPGSGTKAAGSAPIVPEEIDGPPDGVLRFDGPTWAVRYGGSWPGADLTVMRVAQDPADWVSDDVLRELIATLRPATTERWRAFLDTATGDVSEQARTAETLATLFAPDRSGTATTATTEPGPPGPELPPAPDGWLQSPPATLVPGNGPLDSFSDLAGLDVWLEVPQDQVAAGDTLPARIAARNVTAEPIVVNECSDLLTTWGLVPVEEPDAALPGRTIIDCYGVPNHEVPAGETVRWDLTWTQVDPGFVARTSGDGPEWPYLGSLEPGRYFGVVEVPTSTGDLRVSLPITVIEPACEGLTDELVERYLGLSGEEATEQANVDGFTYRVTSIDGRPLARTDDLRCDRLNVDLIGGAVAQVSIF